MNTPKIEIIKKFLGAYNSLDVESMITCLHPDVEFKNISNGAENEHTKGVDEFRILANKAAELFTEREQKIIDYTESDDIINVEINFRGKPASICN